MDRKTDIDIGLAALCKYAPRNYTLKLGDIADVCGCSRQRIEYIQRRALAKLKANHKMRQIASELLKP